jgi:hypothetical protein
VICGGQSRISPSISISTDSSVGIATELWAGRPRNRGLIRGQCTGVTRKGIDAYSSLPFSVEALNGGAISPRLHGLELNSLRRGINLSLLRFPTPVFFPPMFNFLICHLEPLRKVICDLSTKVLGFTPP